MVFRFHGIGQMSIAKLLDVVTIEMKLVWCQADAKLERMEDALDLKSHQ